jgi:trimethylamine--corrinoid protein Co-methyltransferase
MSREQVLAIHQAALEILAQTGFKMEHEGARALLIDAGCSQLNDDWLTMPARLVDDALSTAPRRIVLYDQNGNPAMDLSDEHTFYGTGSDATFTIDLETGVRRRTVLADTGNFSSLVEALEHIDFAMSMGNPADVPVESIYIHAFAEMIKNTSKPLVFIADRLEDISAIHRIASLIAGGEKELEAKPFFLNYSEAISPLRFPANVMDKLVFCAEKNIPLCLPSGSNTGGGAPITPAGAMALGIAENLVGLTVHQLTSPGAPFLFGPNVSALDMKTTVISYGCPEWSLTQAALADMRDELYGLPIWAYAGASDAKIMDAQAGAEAMFSIITGMLSRANLMHDVGFMEFGTTSSLEMVAMANELIDMSRYFTRGIAVNDATLALPVIERVAKGAPGSIFLTDDHTFDHFMTAQFLPQLLDRLRFGAWEEEGGADLYQRCNSRVKELLQAEREEIKSAALLDEIENMLQQTSK